MKENFLYQLKQAGLIENMTVAIYMDDSSNKKYPSTVKFGSYDPLSAKDSKITMLKTDNDKSWDIKSNMFKFKLDNTELKVDTLVKLDPGLPYLYLPKDLFSKIKGFLYK